MSEDRPRVKVSGGEMAFLDVGDGPPALLVHGFPTSSYLWRREIPLLGTRMRVLAPDLMGYGASEKGEGADLSVPAQAGLVAELLEGLGIRKLAVVGHGVGGAVAQLLALSGRFEVPALVLVDSACFDATPVITSPALQAGPATGETFEAVRGAVEQAFDTGMAHRAFLTGGDLDAYLAPWREDPAAFFRAARATRDGALAGRERELGSLDAEAMVIWGEDDPFLPVDLAERLGELLDGSTVAVLPGCSHFVNEDAPRTVGPLVYEFLRARYLGQGHDHDAAHARHGRQGRGGPVPVRVYLERPPLDAEGFGADG